MSLGSNRGKNAPAPARSLHKKPTTSLLSPRSSLSENPNLARPPSLMPSPLAGSKGRTTNGVGPGISLSNSPIQERPRDEEEARRQEQKGIQKARDAWLQKLEKTQALAESIDKFLRRQREGEQELMQLRLARRQKLCDTQHIADRIESLGSADTASVDRHLRLRSLVERGQFIESQMIEWHKEDGINDQTRNAGNKLIFDNDREIEAHLAWLPKLLREQGPIDSHTESATMPLRIKVRLYLILHLRFELAIDGNEIGLLLHKLRQLGRTRLQMSMCPETYSYLRLTFPLEYLTNVLKKDIEAIESAYFTFRDMARMVYLPTSSRLTKIEDKDNFINYAGRLKSSSKAAHRIVRRNLNLFPASTVQTETLMRLRPLVEYNLSWPLFKTCMDNYVDSERYRLRLGRTGLFLHPELQRVGNVKASMADVQRNIHLATGFLWLWTGIRLFSSQICGQSSKGAVPAQNTAAGFELNSIPTLDLTSLSSNSSCITPWRNSASLYPLYAAIPIHYATTFRGLESVISRFSKCDVLGFEIVRAVGNVKHQLVDFVIIASDHEVAIIHLSLMPTLKLHQRLPFEDVLDNPRILKVGVNVEQQRSILDEGLAIDLTRVLELVDAVDHNASFVAGSLQDKNGHFLSAMAARILGSPLPPLDLQATLQDLSTYADKRRIRKVRSVDPLEVFTHLASRAYAALQIYRTAVPTVTTPRTEPSFGPVLLHEPPRELPNPGAQRFRMKYLLAMAADMAEKTANRLTSHTTPCSPKSRRDSVSQQNAIRSANIKRLTAYYLFTTFNEDLEMIGRAMATRFKTYTENVQISSSTSKGKVATEILAIAYDAKLPLRQQDSDLLDYWSRFSRGEVSSLPINTHARIRKIESEMKTNPLMRKLRSGYGHGRSDRTRSAAAAVKPLKKSKPSIASSGLKEQPSRFAYLSESSTSEPLSARDGQLDRDALFIQQLELQLRSTTVASGLSMTARRKEARSLRQRIKRAQRRQRKLAEKETSRRSSHRLASGSTSAEQTPSTKMSRHRPLREQTMGEQEDSPQPSETEAQALADGGTQRNTSCPSDKIASLDLKIKTIQNTERLTRLERASKVRHSKKQARKARMQLEHQEVWVKEIFNVDNGLRIRKFFGTANDAEILKTRAKEEREAAVQAPRAANALKGLLNVDSYNTEGENAVDNKVEAQQELKEELRAPSGDKPWWK